MSAAVVGLITVCVADGAVSVSVPSAPIVAFTSLGATYTPPLAIVFAAAASCNVEAV